jgi:hypothetical protein
MFALKRIPTYFILICLIQICFILCSSCEEYQRNKSHANISTLSIKNGEVLAKKYCVSCHSLPKPEWLDATTWEKGVLPTMGPYLGIFEHRFQDYKSSRYDGNLEKDIYPNQPLLNAVQWQSIIDYYTATSPDKLEGQKREHKIQIGLPLFTVQKAPLNYSKATTSFVTINPNYLSYSLVISDAIRNTTYFFNKDLSVGDSFATSGPTVGIEFNPIGFLTCNIGVLNPNNGKFGSGQFIKKEGGNYRDSSKIIMDGLQRPVQISSADLNSDGKIDYLVCEFGFVAGRLSWMEFTDTGFVRHVLRDLPGAIKAYIEDYNKDGLPDIWVLFAQGEEGVFLFTNKGNGKFEENKVLSFPSVNGSSFFELVDFNKDGLKDIVYTCGDNADFSPVLKPFHGVYIFINKGQNIFEQTFFFPINGCYKALARDYDDDGDLDIATISFFADYKNQPEESFVYLKNEGSNKFIPYSFAESSLGRWLTMDAGDIDGDGLIDIVLGNFFMGPSIIKGKVDWSLSPPFIVLKNTGKNVL